MKLLNTLIVFTLISCGKVDYSKFGDASIKEVKLINEAVVSIGDTLHDLSFWSDHVKMKTISGFEHIKSMSASDSDKEFVIQKLVNIKKTTSTSYMD